MKESYKLHESDAASIESKLADVIDDLAGPVTTEQIFLRSCLQILLAGLPVLHKAEDIKTLAEEPAEEAKTERLRKKAIEKGIFSKGSEEGLINVSIEKGEAQLYRGKPTWYANPNVLDDFMVSEIIEHVKHSAKKSKPHESNGYKPSNGGGKQRAPPKVGDKYEPPRKLIEQGFRAVF